MRECAADALAAAGDESDLGVEAHTLEDRLAADAAHHRVVGL